MKKWNGIILMLLAAVLVLSACGSGSGNTAGTGSESGNKEAEQSTDNAKRTVETIMGKVEVLKLTRSVSSF